MQTRGKGCRTTTTSNDNARSIDVNQKLKCVWQLGANKGATNTQPSALPLFDPTKPPCFRVLNKPLGFKHLCEPSRPSPLQVKVNGVGFKFRIQQRGFLR